MLENMKLWNLRCQDLARICIYPMLTLCLHCLYCSYARTQTKSFANRESLSYYAFYFAYRRKQCTVHSAKWNRKAYIDKQQPSNNYILYMDPGHGHTTIAKKKQQQKTHTRLRSWIDAYNYNAYCMHGVCVCVGGGGGVWIAISFNNSEQ